MNLSILSRFETQWTTVFIHNQKITTPQLKNLSIYLQYQHPQIKAALLSTFHTLLYYPEMKKSSLHGYQIHPD